MPYPDDESLTSANNLLIYEETSYDRNDMQQDFENFDIQLTKEQGSIFNEIMTVVRTDNGGVFFVYGYGGTGKTFLWKTLSSAIKKDGDIVLNVASSDIASLLLSGGRTAHSRFIITFNLTEVSKCTIEPKFDLSNLIVKTKLIIWDEAPMAHKHGFEALDKSLRNILNCENQRNSSKEFGAKVVVFGGDFRQILPVVANASRQEIVNASLCSSYLWSSCKVLRLTKNMRLNNGVDSNDNEEIKYFANWLLDMGEGKVGGSNDGEAIVEIPDDLLIKHYDDPIYDLIEFVYTHLLRDYKKDLYFQESSILAPKNEVVDEINDRLLSIFPGEEKVYLGSDSISQEEHLDGSVDDGLYSPDILNGIKCWELKNAWINLKSCNHFQIKQLEWLPTFDRIKSDFDSRYMYGFDSVNSYRDNR